MLHWSSYEDYNPSNYDIKKAAESLSKTGSAEKKDTDKK